MLCVRVVLHDTQKNPLCAPLKKKSKKKPQNILTGPNPTTASVQTCIATCKPLVAVMRDARCTKNQSRET